MFPTRRAALALALAAVALGACSDDPFAPDLAPEGDARFTYTGERSGEFVAEGRLNRRAPNAGTWAVGERQAGTGGSQILAIFGQQRQPELKVDYLFLEWAGAQVGSVTCAAGAATCPFTAIFLYRTDRLTEVAEARYARARGTVTITEFTENRAVGTFALTLLREGSGDPPTSIQVNGSFDVPLNVMD